MEQLPSPGGVRIRRARHANVLKEDLPGGNVGFVTAQDHEELPRQILHIGLDLSRKRVDVHVLAEAGGTVEVTTAPPDADGLSGLAERISRYGGPVRAAIESMNGARFVDDELELAGRISRSPRSAMRSPCRPPSRRSWCRAWGRAPGWSARAHGSLRPSRGAG